MPIVWFKPGDFVEFDSHGNTKRVFKGILHSIGWIGAEPKQPRQIAFVDIHDGRRPFYVAADRLRHANAFALWMTRMAPGAA